MLNPKCTFGTRQEAVLIVSSIHSAITQFAKFCPEIQKHQEFASRLKALDYTLESLNRAFNSKVLYDKAHLLFITAFVESKEIGTILGNGLQDEFPTAFVILTKSLYHVLEDCLEMFE